MSDFIYPSISDDRWESIWNEKSYGKIEAEIVGQQQEWARSKRPETTDGWLPRHLYKFKSVDLASPERTTKIFLNQTLWVSSLEELNDPLETAFVVPHGSAGEPIAKGMNHFFNTRWNGYVCLTEDPVCPQMWAHYAASHSGYCIAYRRSDSLLLCSTECRRIRYRPTPPVIDDGNVRNPDVADQIFWTKFDNWEYEREWRLRYPRASAYLPDGLLVPEGIIFGLRTSEGSMALLRSCAKNVRFGRIVPVESSPYDLQVKWESARAK